VLSRCRCFRGGCSQTVRKRARLRRQHLEPNDLSSWAVPVIEKMYDDLCTAICSRAGAISAVPKSCGGAPLKLTTMVLLRSVLYFRAWEKKRMSMAAPAGMPP
jgi:hypothetical protein